MSESFKQQKRNQSVSSWYWVEVQRQNLKSFPAFPNSRHFCQKKPSLCFHLLDAVQLKKLLKVNIIVLTAQKLRWKYFSNNHCPPWKFIKINFVIFLFSRWKIFSLFVNFITLAFGKDFLIGLESVRKWYKVHEKKSLFQ